MLKRVGHSILFYLGVGLLATTIEAASLCVGTPAEYVIITSDARLTAFDNYVTAKNGQSIPTRVFSTDDIEANYTGVDTQEKIRNFIIDAYTTWSISYVLLGGDEYVVPIRYYGSKIFDAYYYNLSGDGYSGTVSVLGGRMPTKDFLQTQRIANRWAVWDGTASWTRENAHIGWAGNELSSLSKFNGTAIGTGDVQTEITDAIEAGSGIVHYFGHGAWGGWASSTYGFPNARNLMNQDKVPYVVAASCLTGTFDSTNNIAEAFFESPSGGVLAYIGANQTIWMTDAYNLNSGIFGNLRTSYYENGRVQLGAIYHFGGFQKTKFNYLGDPSAELDLRLPGDVTLPAITGSYVSHATRTAYQKVSIAATVTDNDEVSSNVWAVLTHPDLSTTQINLSRAGTSTTYSGQFSGTDQLGAYSIIIHAQDISANEQTAGPHAFTVNDDTTAPVITSTNVTPAIAVPGEQVTFDINVTDDSGALMSVYLGVTVPTQPLPTYVTETFNTIGGAYYSFTITTKPGDYQAHVQCTDQSGNATALIPIVENFPDTAFTVIADNDAPTLNAQWYINASGMSWPMGPNEYAITNLPIGSDVVTWVDVTDAATPEGMDYCWSEMIAPNGSQSTMEQFMWMGTGVYPPGTGYASMNTLADQVGFYSVTVYARDVVGNVSEAYVGPLNVYQPPTQLSANPGDAQVQLAWVAADSGYPIVGYNVNRSLVSADSNTILVNGSLVAGTTYSDSLGLSNGTTYYYRVIAVDSAGNTCGRTSESSAVPTAAFVSPLPPIGIIATPGDGEVFLNWQAGIAGTNVISGYNVYRAESSGGQGVTPLNGVIIAGLSYTDSTAVNDTEYFYILKSEDSAANESVASTEVSLKPYEPASQVVDLAATSGNAEAYVAWSAPVAGTYALDRIELYRGTSSGAQGPQPVTVLATTADAYTDTQVANGTEYFYYMKTRDVQNHYSADSNENSATPNISLASQPANPTASGQVNQIRIAWDNNEVSELLIQYNVYQDTSSGFTPGPGNLLAQVTYNEFSSPYYDDTSTTNGITYYYCVKAENARGMSVASTEVSAASVDPPTATPSITPTVSSTPTSTRTPTVSATLTVSSTQTLTSTGTPMVSMTCTPTISMTATNTETETPTLTITNTSTLTPSTTITRTATPSATTTNTRTRTATLTHSATITVTATMTVTSSVTPMVSQTPTYTATATHTQTQTPTRTRTATPTAPAITVAVNEIVAYPNPARDQVHFSWPESNVQQVKIDIFNVIGERIASVSTTEPTTNTIIWLIENTAPGIYYYRLVLTLEGNAKKTKLHKIVIIR
jgi:peptidase C25-like protein/type IX secretion system substrate protein